MALAFKKGGTDTKGVLKTFFLAKIKYLILFCLVFLFSCLVFKYLVINFKIIYLENIKIKTLFFQKFIEF